MNVKINLTQLNLEEIEQILLIISNSIDFNIETEEMQTNYESSQDIECYLLTLIDL